MQAKCQKWSGRTSLERPSPDRSNGDGGSYSHGLRLFAATQAANSCIRQRTTHESDIQHADETNVGNELAAAAHHPIILLALQTRTDSLPTIAFPICARPKLSPRGRFRFASIRFVM
jgi:hypothetical protein